MRAVVAIVATMLAACGAAPVRLAPPSTPPSSRDVLRALSAHASLDPVDPSCSNVTGDLEDETLGMIESHLLAQLADAQAEGEPAHLSAACEPQGPPWPCRFDVRIEAEDPWAYGISFTLDAAGAIDPASIRCPGGS